MDFDAVIVGAGPAGSTLSRCLAKDGLKVLMIDKEPIGRGRACGGFLGPEVKSMMKQLDLGDIENSIEHLSISTVEVSGPGEFDFKTALSRGTGMSVKRSQFDAYLAEQARHAGVAQQAPAVLMSSAYQDKQWRLEIADHSSVRTILCRFLVYATGRRSFLKKKALFSNHSFYACKATYQNLNALTDEVVLHFVEKGHVGLNPLGGGTATLCLYTDEINIRKVKGDLDKMVSDFARQNKYLEMHLRGAERISGWQTCQAEPDGKKLFYREGAFFVGDAVSMVHPIIGGGIPIAMQSAQLLSQELIRGMKSDRDLKRIAASYEKKWNQHFSTRTRFAMTLGHIERSPWIMYKAFRLMRILSGLFPFLVRFSRPDV